MLIPCLHHHLHQLDYTICFSWMIQHPPLIVPYHLSICLLFPFTLLLLCLLSFAPPLGTSVLPFSKGLPDFYSSLTVGHQLVAKGRQGPESSSSFVVVAMAVLRLPQVWHGGNLVLNQLINLHIRPRTSVSIIRKILNFVPLKLSLS